MKDLENTVITLAEENEETDSYKSAEAMAQKLKKKRKIDDNKMKGKNQDKKEKPEI